MEQLLGVRFSAGSERPILPEVLMYYRHLTASLVKVCYYLAPSAVGFARVNRTWVAISERFCRQFSGLDFLGVTAAVEQLAYFLW